MKNAYGRHAIAGPSAFRPCTASRRVEPEKTKKKTQQAKAAATATTTTTHSSIKGQIPICFPTQEKVHRWAATVFFSFVRERLCSSAEQQLHLELLAFTFDSFVHSSRLFISLRQERRGNRCAMYCATYSNRPTFLSRILFSHYYHNGVLLHNKCHSILIQSPFSSSSSLFC